MPGKVNTGKGGDGVGDPCMTMTPRAPGVAPSPRIEAAGQDTGGDFFHSNPRTAKSVLRAKAAESKMACEEAMARCRELALAAMDGMTDPAAKIAMQSAYHSLESAGRTFFCVLPLAFGSMDEQQKIEGEEEAVQPIAEEEAVIERVATADAADVAIILLPPQEREPGPYMTGPAPLALPENEWSWKVPKQGGIDFGDKGTDTWWALACQDWSGWERRVWIPPIRLALPERHWSWKVRMYGLDFLAFGTDTWWELAAQDWSGWEAKVYVAPTPMLQDDALDEGEIVWDVTDDGMDWGEDGLEFYHVGAFDWGAEGLPCFDVGSMGWSDNGVPF